MKKKFLKKMKNAAAQMVLSGQHTHPQKILEVDIPQKAAKRLRRRLDTSENWQRDGSTVYNAHGITAVGIASWGRGICIRLGGYDHRFQVLYLDRFGRRTIFLLPIGSPDKTLPGVDLGSGEFQLLLKMADDLRSGSARKERLVNLKNPLRRATKNRLAPWRREPCDESKLLKLLESTLALLPVLTSALDAQLRTLKQMQDAPAGIYNFILPRKDSAAADWLVAVLQTVSFSNEPTYQPGPILVREPEDGERCYQRLVLLNAAGRGTIQPLLDKLELYDRIRKSGGLAPPQDAFLPIVMSRSALCSSHAVDLELLTGTTLSASQRDLLRSAVSRCLSRKFATEICAAWIVQLHSVSAYRMSGFSVWRQLLVRQAVQTWFTDEDLLDRARTLCEQTQQEEDAAEKQREESLQKAFALVTDPAQYDDQIIDRPASVAEARDKLSDTAVAFHYEPGQGNDRGRHFLAFIKGSLLRLLKQAGCHESLFDAFLDRCQQNGVLDQKNRTIKLGDQTLPAITIRVEK